MKMNQVGARVWVGIILLCAGMAASAQTVSLSPSAITNRTWQGLAVAPDAVDVLLEGGGSESLSFQALSLAAWLSVTPSNGVLTAQMPYDTLTLSYSTAALVPGMYTGPVMVVSGTMTETAIVELEVLPSHRVLAIDPPVQTVTTVAGVTNRLTTSLTVWNAATPAQALPMSWYVMNIEQTWWLDIPEPEGDSSDGPVVHALHLVDLDDLDEPGIYTARVVVATMGLAASNSPLEAVVLLEVLPPPPDLSLVPLAVSLEVNEGMMLAEQELTVSSMEYERVYYDVESYAPWLLALPSRSWVEIQNPDTVRMIFYTETLEPGHYLDYIRVTPRGARSPDETRTARVSLTVRPSPYVIGLAGDFLGTARMGSTEPVTLPFQVWNKGSDQPMFYEVSAYATFGNWLQEALGGGTAGSIPVDHVLTLDPQDAGLYEGDNEGTVTIWAPDSPLMVFSTVIFRVSSDIRINPAPVVCVLPEGVATSTVPIQIWNAGSANPVDYTLTLSAPWVSASADAGNSAGETNTVNLSFDATGLEPGVYRSAIRLEGVYQETDIPVIMTVGSVIGPYEERVVFSAILDGRDTADLWSIRPDGTDRRLLYSQPRHQSLPAISFDGTKILFREAEQLRWVIYDLFSGKETEYEDLHYSTFRWLSDAYDMVYARIDHPALPPRFFKRSYDGAEAPLFYAREAHVDILGADPDNQMIYYTERPQGGQVSGVYRQHPEASTRETLLAPTAGQRAGGDVAPGGGAVHYSFINAPLYSEFSFRELNVPDGRETIRLPEPQEHLFGGTYSPDGQHVYVLANRDNQRHIVRMNRTTGERSTIFSAPLTAMLGGLDAAVILAATPSIHLSEDAFDLVADPSAQTLMTNHFALSNSGDGLLLWSAESQVDWLHPVPDSGAIADEVVSVELLVRPDGLADGIYTGRVVFSANNSEAPTQVMVILRVTRSRIAMMEQLETSASAGGSPAVLGVPVWNAGEGSFTYQASPAAAWMTVTAGGTGAVSDSAVDVTVSCSPAGLAEGIYTGDLVVVGDNRQTNRTTVVFHVLEPAGPAPVPVLSTNRIVLTNYVGEFSRPEGLFYVTNSAPGNVLSVYITKSAGWINPFPSYTRPDWLLEIADQQLIILEANPRGLTAGVHEGTLTVHGQHGTGVVEVVLHTLAERPATLSISSTPGGGVVHSPVLAEYPVGSVVALTATSAPFHVFSHWEGPVSATRDANVTLVIPSARSVAVRAHFRPQYGLQGYVTNRVTGAPIPGVALLFGANLAVATDANGWYAIETPNTNRMWLTYRRSGYQAPGNQRVRIAGGPAGKRQDFGMDPTAVSQFRLFYNKRSQEIDITYNLAGTRTDLYTVTLQASNDGGHTWTLPVRTVRGDAGRRITGGKNKRIIWSIGEDHPETWIPQLKVRLLVNGQEATAPSFAFHSLPVYNWTLIAYIDRNNNNQYDPGEELPHVSFHIGSRTNITGVSDASGRFRLTSPAYSRMPVFARRKVFIQSAEKRDRELVHDTMFDLWMDSDIGRDHDNWDGVWRTRELLSGDIHRIENGLPVYVKLGHPVFEWNLLVHAPTADATLLRNMRSAMGRASEYLYRITHGQMKLGDIHISTTMNGFTTPDVDVQIQSGRANAHVDGIWWDNYTHTRMFLYDLPRNNTIHNTYSEFGRVFIHEMGHYAFNFLDECGPYVGIAAVRNDTWGWGRNQYPKLFPANFGYMHQHRTIDTMSSANDYLLDPYDYIPAGYSENDPPTHADLTRWLTIHAYGREYRDTSVFYPTWEYLQRKFNMAYGDNLVDVRLIGQRPGFFVNGASTSIDRTATFRIPAPYAVCRVRIDDGDWLDPYTSESVTLQRAVRAPRHLHVQVTHQGGVCPGARVILRRADHPLRNAGLTGADGFATLFDWSPGDTLEVYWRGQRMARELDARTASPVVMEFGGIKKHGALSPDQLGVVVGGLLMDTNTYALTLFTSHVLDAPPTVTVHYPDGSTAAVSMTHPPHDLRRYSGTMDLQGWLRGHVEIACASAGRSPFHTLDDFELIPVSNIDMLSDAVVEPGPAARSLDTRGLLYQAYGPVILPDTSGMPPTNQVSYAVHFAMIGSMPSPAHPFGLNFDIDRDALRGLDLEGLSAWQWDETAKVWQENRGWLNLDDALFHATLENHPMVALFAPSSTDTTPPGSIMDLVAFTGPAAQTVVLEWTAPSGDGDIGQAMFYDLRFSESDVGWEASIPYALSIAPAPAGAAESVTITLPKSYQHYTFGIRALDGAGNLSPTNNTAAAQSGMLDEDGDGICDNWMADVRAVAGVHVTADCDLDEDGLTTLEEFLLRTDPNNWDTDGDGMSDGFEARHGLNPLDPSDAHLDNDGDGLTNLEESWLGTDPNNWDTSGDGMSDEWKLRMGLDPLTTANDFGAEDDPDEDGYTNLQEYIADTDPLDPDSFLHVKEIQSAPTGFTVYLDASPARLFGIQASGNPAVEGSWQPVLAPQYGQGADTPFTLPVTNTHQLFRIHAEVP